MILLILFSFLGGVVTILSPCILPILPVVLSGGIGGGKRKPFGIVTGFILSFTFFTLFLSSIVKSTGISADYLRAISIIVILIFGISLLLPQFQLIMEKIFSKVAGKFAGQKKRDGFGGGVVIGLSLGLIWTPCVGPILASIITLAATSDVTFGALFITLAYSIGTAIPMLAVMYGGRNLLQKVPWLLPNTEKIQKGFGVLLVLTAIGIFFNIDRRFQSYILETFPKYGVGLTGFEDNDLIKNELKKLKNNDQSANSINTDDFGSEKIKAPEIIPGGAWFNLPAGEVGTDVLTLDELKGKVVLIDFWTYTCINCQRTFPYLREWHKKYEDDGLVILGVHSPEFEFEKKEENVAQAIADFDLTYPIVQDNNFDTWQAYDNRYWPAKYLIDKDGFVRYTHFGEGEYAKTEQMIQKLLKETGKDISIKIENSEKLPAGRQFSPETYLGSQRMQFYYPDGNLNNGPQSFTLFDNIPEYSFSLGGNWTVTDEHLRANRNASLNLNFKAGKVFLVMNKGRESGSIKVFLDSRLVDDQNSGDDVVNGEVTINKNTLYELIDLKDKSGEHLLRLEFTEGIEAFAFTFG